MKNFLCAKYCEIGILKLKFKVEQSNFLKCIFEGLKMYTTTLYFMQNPGKVTIHYVNKTTFHLGRISILSDGVTSNNVNCTVQKTFMYISMPGHFLFIISSLIKNIFTLYYP